MAIKNKLIQNLPESSLDAAVITKLNTTGDGGSSNPNIIVVDEEADLYDVANAGKILDIQTDITLTANRTLANGVTLYFSTGKIITNGFNLIGNNLTKFEGLTKDQVYFQLDETSQLTGSWQPPQTLTTKMFGVRENGILQLGNGTIAKGSTTFTGVGFTASDVDKVITIVSAGAPPSVPYHTNVGTFTVGETITFGTSLSTAQIVSITPSVTTPTSGVIVMENLIGVIPAIDEVITGSTSGATAIIRFDMQNQGYALVTTITGYTNSTTVTVADAAVISATNTNYIYGDDDYNLVYNALEMTNRKGGTDLIIGTSGKIMTTSVIMRNDDLKVKPNGWVIGNSTDGHNLYFLGDIQLFAHDIPRTSLFTSWRTENTNFIGVGGKVLGDFRSYDGENIYEGENGKIEHNHAITIMSLADNSIITGMKIVGFYGDTIYSQGDTQFMNQIDGLNKVDGATDTGITVGFVNKDGTIDGANTKYIYSTNLLPLTGFQFDNITDRGKQRWVALTGNSFGAWEGLVNPYFWIAYYDASNNFLFRTEKLTWFMRVPIPDKKYVKARVILYNPDEFGGNKDDVSVNLRPDLHPLNCEISFNELSHCGRQAISNPPSGYRIFDNYGHDIGGLDAGPCAFVDVEDGGRIKQNGWIYNNVIENCWIGIILKNCENVEVYGNTIKYETKDQSGAPTTYWRTGISSYLGRNVTIHHNILQGCADTIDRQNNYHHNTKFGGTLSYTANSNVIDSNDLWDVTLTHTYNTSQDRVDHPTRITNNNIYISQKVGSDYLFAESNNAAIFENNIIQYNAVGNWEFSKQSTDNDIIIGGNSENRLHLRGNMIVDLGGYWKNNRIYGGKPDIATRDYTSGNSAFPILDYYGDVIETPMEFKQGLPRDFKLEKMTIKSWIEFDLDQWSGTLSNPNTISIIDCDVIIEDGEFPWVNTGSNILTTAVKNANLYAKNTTFTIEPSFTYTTSSQKLFNLAHLGTTVFENCTFDIQNMATYHIDLTRTGNFGASLGAVTFINPILKNGAYITLRAGDKILFTYPSVNAPLYADNATALAALGDGYYYKLTATGEPKITYTPL